MFPQTDLARNVLMPGTLRLCYRLSSLAVRVMVRELLKVAGKSCEEAKLQNKVYDLAFACKIRLAYIQQFVTKVHSGRSLFVFCPHFSLLPIPMFYLLFFFQIFNGLWISCRYHQQIMLFICFIPYHGQKGTFFNIECLYKF